MSTIVCQNTKSCFEFDTLSLKLNPPNMTPKSPSLDSTTTTGWSCIESLSNGSNLLHKQTTNKLEVYVHPLVKRSSSMLSDKSLEMCTENLGSETGTDITEDDDIFSILITTSLDSDQGEESSTKSRKPRYHKMESKKAGYESLPPPLTTMCGANTIRVQPHRESGRLVMTAVTTSPRKSSVHAERCDGRLTMSLAEDVFDDVGEEEEEEEVNDETLCLIDEGEEVEEEEEESVEEEEQEEASLEEGKDGISKEVGDKFGINIGEFQRLSRCKEGGRGTTRRLINWETFCLAT